MDISAFLRKIRHFFSRIPLWRWFARQSSKSSQIARNRTENSLQRQEKPPGIPPDDHRSPEDLRRDALAMAQEWQDRLFERAPHIDLVIGTHNIHKLVELIRERQAKSGHYLEADMTVPAFHDLPTKRFQKFFAWVPIMNGCNKFCTYCIVPYVRGREVSRPIADIVREIEEIAKEGYKEITLLGQNVNSYGLDLKDGTDFSALLQAVDRIDGIERVRYMTSHPKDMTFAMIDAIADSRKVVNHMHLPIQSGSDELLKKMNRGYTVDQYMELVEYARSSGKPVLEYRNPEEEDFFDNYNRFYEELQ